MAPEVRKIPTPIELGTLRKISLKQGDNLFEGYPGRTDSEAPPLVSQTETPKDVSPRYWDQDGRPIKDL